MEGEMGVAEAVKPAVATNGTQHPTQESSGDASREGQTEQKKSIRGLIFEKSEKIEGELSGKTEEEQNRAFDESNGKKQIVELKRLMEHPSGNLKTENFPNGLDFTKGNPVMVKIEGQERKIEHIEEADAASFLCRIEGIDKPQLVSRFDVFNAQLVSEKDAILSQLSDEEKTKLEKYLEKIQTPAEQLLENSALAHWQAMVERDIKMAQERGDKERLEGLIEVRGWLGLGLASGQETGAIYKTRALTALAKFDKEHGIIDLKKDELETVNKGLAEELPDALAAEESFFKRNGWTDKQIAEYRKAIEAGSLEEMFRKGVVLKEAPGWDVMVFGEKKSKEDIEKIVGLHKSKLKDLLLFLFILAMSGGSPVLKQAEKGIAGATQ